MDLNEFVVADLIWAISDRLTGLERVNDQMLKQYQKDQTEAAKSSEVPIEKAVDNATSAPKWRVTSSAASDVDGLCFTSRDSEGQICWWDAPTLNNDDPLAHEALGRACAFDLLNLIHNSEKTEELDKHTFSFIASEIAKRGYTMNAGLYKGFFEMISEYLIAGTADR